MKCSSCNEEKDKARPLTNSGCYYHEQGDVLCFRCCLDCGKMINYCDSSPWAEELGDYLGMKAEYYMEELSQPYLNTGKRGI